MQLTVTALTQSDEILVEVPAPVAAEELMVDLQVRHAAADLASPAISPKNAHTDLLAESVINLR